MVQVIDIEDPRSKLSEMLGLSLGQGIGSGLNTFFANRSLDSVLHDKALEGAPSSKKLEALRSAMAPYGQQGQEIFQQRMAIDQQEQQERNEQQQEVLQQKKGRALGRYLSGKNMTPDEQSLFTPAEFVAIYKAKNPKASAAVTSQMVPPEISSKIGEVINHSQGMSADDLKNVLDSVGIPPIYTNQYIENRRRSEERGTEHDIKFHQETHDFDKQLRDHANTARKQIPLIESSIKSVSEGKINPGSLANVFGFFGERGKKISNALLSGSQAALLASIPEFLEGRKELFGVRLSDADLKILQDKLPDIGKSKEANLAILKLMKKSADRSIKLEKISHEVLEKKGIPYRGGKLRPLGYEKDVMNALDDLMDNEGKFSEMPPASDHAGKTIEDERGVRFKSNGTTWVPI